jgi:hypothetical protein
MNENMTPSEQKAREIVKEFRSTLIDEAVPEYFPKLVYAISKAIDDEREACAKIAENDDSFMMLQDFGLQSAVTQKGQNIAAAIRSRETDNG